MVERAPTRPGQAGDSGLVTGDSWKNRVRTRTVANVRHDPNEETEHRTSRGARNGAPGRDRRGVAGTKPQQQAPALGAIESAQPKTNSHACRGAGAPANSRTTAGTTARTPQCHDRRTRTAGGPDASAAGGGSTTVTTPRERIAARTGRRDNFFMAHPKKRGTVLYAMFDHNISAIGLSPR